MDFNKNPVLWKAEEVASFAHEFSKNNDLVEWISNNAVDGFFLKSLTREDYTDDPMLLEWIPKLQKTFEEIAKKFGPNFDDMGEEIDIISNQAPLHIEIKVLDADYKNFDEEILQFGREEGSTIRFDDKSISRNHSMIYACFNTYFIRDEKSSNGTFVLLEKDSEFLLDEKLILEFSNLEFRFEGIGQMRFKLIMRGENEEVVEFEENLMESARRKIVVGEIEENRFMTFKEDREEPISNLRDVFSIANENSRLEIKILAEDVFIRLSPEKTQSEFFPLPLITTFKVGDKLCCSKSNSSFNPAECLLCKEGEKEADFYMHNCRKFYYCDICAKFEIDFCIGCNNLIRMEDSLPIYYLKSLKS